jgi:hypothetical protein
MAPGEELFLQQVLEDRDRLFREASKLKSQLAGYENFETERAAYQRQLEENKQAIIMLKQQVETLQRRIWGKSSEKYIAQDPLQRKLDFEGLDLVPEEKELATSAKEEIEKYKTIRVKVQDKSHPVRKPLPESLPREEALKEDKVRASYALEQIGLLYDVERHADKENLSDEQRAELRSRLSYPIMVAFEKWVLSEYPKVLPKGRIGKALRYTYNIYHKLTRYHLDGKLKMDNNLAENAIRPISLGRKNWLFCGNYGSAENAAIMYSMLGCCKAAGVNFRDWLVFFLNNIHQYDDDYSKDLAELLPHNFKPQNQNCNSTVS